MQKKTRGKAAPAQRIVRELRIMKRETFGSRLGFLLLSAGCAIGIGNVWRFPYVVGQNGGGAFVLLYLLGFDRCYGGGYLMVCLKGALFGLWVLPLFLVVNAVLDWRNVDTLRGLLHTLTIKKGATEEKHDAE